MWQHNVYYVCVTFSVVRYVGLTVQIDHHQGVRRGLVKVTEFKKKTLSLKFLKVNRGDVAA